MTVKTEKATLLLADGSVFEGLAFGARRETLGETVFATGMTGYLETLTDPSYYGQIVVQTFPLIGNYGVIKADFESDKPWVSGYVVRQWCEAPSNFRCEYDLDRYLKEQDIPGIYGIDTRRLTKLIRESGVMSGLIYPGVIPENEKEKLLAGLQGYSIKDAVKAVGCDHPQHYESQNPTYHVALLDFGAKRNIIRALQKRGCNVTVLPGYTPPNEVLALKPDGIMLSNGPGDPAENIEIIDNLKILMLSGVPTFGICLGHQLMALAAGAKTQKLKYGHRGANQPVRDVARGRVFITSQNHGYAVVGDSLPQNRAVVSHINANDGTCEGVRYLDMPAFSLQFHPEACAGPQDTEHLFSQFIAMMEEVKGNAAE